MGNWSGQCEASAAGGRGRSGWRATTCCGTGAPRRACRRWNECTRGRAVEAEVSIHVVVQVGVVAVHLCADARQASARWRSSSRTAGAGDRAPGRRTRRGAAGSSEGADEAQGCRAVVERGRARHGGRLGLAQHGLFDAFEPALAGHVIGVEARDDGTRSRRRNRSKTPQGCRGETLAPRARRTRGRPRRRRPWSSRCRRPDDLVGRSRPASRAVRQVRRGSASSRTG